MLSIQEFFMLTDDVSLEVGIEVDSYIYECKKAGNLEERDEDLARMFLREGLVLLLVFCLLCPQTNLIQDINFKSTLC